MTQTGTNPLKRTMQSPSSRRQTSYSVGDNQDSVFALQDRLITNPSGTLFHGQKSTKKRASDGLKPVFEMLKSRFPVVKIFHREALSWSVSLLLRNFKLMILYKKVDESGVKWGNFS